MTMMEAMLKEIDEYFADACDYSGVTVEEILARYNYDKYQLAEAMVMTGFSIEEILEDL